MGEDVTSFIFKVYLIFYLYGILPSCVSVCCVCNVSRSQKRKSDPLELEKQMFGIHQMGAMTQTRSFGRNTNALNC